MNPFGLGPFLKHVKANVYKVTIIGTRWALFVATFLTVSAGYCLAQAFLPTEVWVISTVPSNGDVNPYGVTFVPNGFQTGRGPLQPGDVLVSNFNNRKNLQGTGTTIVRVSSSGAQSLFFQGKGSLGLSTALGTLSAGFVVVGNAPTKNGTAATASPGSLLVINNQGQLVQSFADPKINYPWDMTLVDNGDSAIAFVSNALDGTVTRLKFAVASSGPQPPLTLLGQATTIATDYVNRSDPVTLFVAPTGTVYDPVNDILYVASTGDNAIYAIHHAASTGPTNGKGDLIYQDNMHLHGALGLAWAPNGHLLVTNNDGINPDPSQPSEIVEFTITGQFVKQISLDPAFGGAFGLATQAGQNQLILAAVNDNTATIDIFHITP